LQSAFVDLSVNDDYVFGRWQLVILLANPMEWNVALLTLHRWPICSTILQGISVNEICRFM